MAVNLLAVCKIYVKYPGKGTVVEYGIVIENLGNCMFIPQRC